MKMNLILNLIYMLIPPFIQISPYLVQNQDRWISPYLDVCANGFPFMSESVCNPSGPSNLGDVIIIIIDQ